MSNYVASFHGLLLVMISVSWTIDIIDIVERSLCSSASRSCDIVERSLCSSDSRIAGLDGLLVMFHTFRTECNTYDSE